MVSEIKAYYNIIEPWDDKNEYDVGNYLYDNRIRYSIRVVKEIDFDIDLNWMATRKDKHFVIYTVELMPEEALFIGIKFPNLQIKKPIIKETIDKMARRVLLL